MLLEVRHVTRYLYDEPVRESIMEVWMQPQKGALQRLVSFDLEIDPAAQLFSYPDPFGNAVYHFDVPQPHDQLTITARSAVETQPATALPEALDLGEWDRLRSDFVLGENFEFLRPHGFARETEALRAFMAEKGLDKLRARDPLSAVRALSAIVYDSFAYEAGVTRADSPIDDSLQARRGVCQDFAHVMLAICRAWGVPARYVSGYLFTDRKAGDRSDPDATHAWVEVFLPSLRWIGFDPTNNIVAGERHIACAVGRDYSDVPPSRGVYKGDAESQLAVGVSVRRARAALSDPEFLRTSQPTRSRNGQRRAAGNAYEQQQRQQQQQQQ
ncbi:transglutaminase family protein [Phenylobacterium hankyongense]|uniref:Transglutaminase family protein n=1 Tax=Phenylobacterium hankyongense TaxID=1813876 RepID=A0A328B433_9CAUL|nr:transglutaminase family protein [Phenylobacterium hankyongense]RAK61325.1 transglutaminase family protein [Phenylobacterium hankyongense]